MATHLIKIICFSILFLSLALARDSHIKHRLFMTANICDIDEGSSFYDAIRQVLEKNNDPTSLLVNGDLIKGKFTSGDSLRIQKLVSLEDALPDGRIIILSGVQRM